MVDNTSSSDPPPAAPPQSEGLFCPNCEYDLTGLTEPRCPECGEPFDREELINWSRLRQRSDAPLLIDGTTGPPAILRILRDSLFHPVRLARQISPAVGKDCVLEYSVATRVVAGAILLLCSSLAESPGPRDNRIAVFIMPLIVCGVSVGCEVYLARIMSRNLKPYMVPSQHRYRFCRTVCQCYSGHLIITCLIVGLWGIVVSRQRVIPVNDHTVNTLFGVLCVASVLWWWINLGIAVAIRGGRSSIRYVVILLIPLIAAAGGLVVFIPLMLLCSVVF